MRDILKIITLGCLIAGCLGAWADDGLKLSWVDQPVNPNSDLYTSTLRDPWLGYRVIALIDKSTPGKSRTAQSATIFYLDLTSNRFVFLANWKVSTGVEIPSYKEGRLVSNRETRAGFYRAELLDVAYVSKSYREEMPYSVFYDRIFGTAIHATAPQRYKRLGTRASMGCTRLTYDNAKLFYELIASYGFSAVVKVSWLTGHVADPPQVVRSYPALIINTEPGNPNSRVQIEPDNYVDDPESLRELLPL
jgi:hypothetical protein